MHTQPAAVACLNEKGHRGVVGVLITFIAALGLMSLASAEDAVRHEVNIEAQPIGAALKALADQTGLQVLVFSQDAGDKRSPAVQGRMTNEEALAVILGNSGLTYQRIDEKTVAVRAVGSAGLGVGAVAATKGVQVAQGEEGAGEGPQEERGAQLEEIVVTAQKREERLQDVPISMSVLGGADLDKRTSGGLHEALASVPGVTIVSGGAAAFGTSSQVMIRGVAASSLITAGSSPAGYYLDGVPFAFVKQSLVPDLAVYDLDRVEVLRGPQGTLFGAGSQSGVVRVLTMDPNLDKFEFKTRALMSQTRYGGDNGQLDMAMNVPIVPGKLAARAVLGYQGLSGWIDKPTRADANDSRQRTARIKLTAQPTEALSATLSAWMSRSDSGAFPVAYSGGLTYPIADVESVAADFDTYGLKVSYDFSAFSLTSMTSYLEFSNSVESGESTGPGTSVRSFLNFDLSPRTFSQEVNLASTHGGAWRWTAGAIYRDSVDRQFQELVVLTFPDVFEFTSKSWAAFGELTRLLFDGQLELTAGFRHFNDDVGTREESRLGFVQPGTYVSVDSKFHANTPRLIMTWKPHARSNTFYASYSEGFRSGWDQQPPIFAAGLSVPSVQPDLLKNYELGAKGSNLFGGRLVYDAAVYYMQWEDVQQTLARAIEASPGVIVQGRTVGVNGEGASGVGVDLGFNVHAAKGLDVGMTLSWNDLKLDGDVFHNDSQAGNVLLLAKDSRLNLSPATTLGAQATYSFPLGDLTGRLSARADYTSSKSSRRILFSGVPVIENVESVVFGRAAFAIDSPDNWGVTLFCDNIGNTDSALFRSVDFLGQTTEYVPRPRTIGIQLDYRL